MTISVEEAGNEEATYVAFKTFISTTSCPVSYSSINFQAPTSTANISWSFDESWTLMTCRENWTRFERDDMNVICMQVFPVPNIKTLADAKQYCVDEDSVLTGVATIDECWWIKTRLLEIFPNISQFYGFWVDGVRNCSRADNTCTVTDDFIWSDGYTPAYPYGTGAYQLQYFSLYNIAHQPEDCLSVTILTYTHLNDVECLNFYGSLGVTCGYLLQKLK
ncbi:unnamed protein product [Caenorhabditis sp. 36 PRJEB53466]|nr:unnamed protein product [Caenorhabditis sp. 36 PRJEB53466]